MCFLPEDVAASKNTDSWTHPTPFALATKASAAAPRDEHIAALSAALEAGGMSASTAIERISAAMPGVCFSEAGSRMVCRAFEVASPAAVRQLAAALRGHVLRAATSPHAHLVLEVAVLHSPAQDVAFIAEELACAASSVALNSYGCHVLCRLLEVSAGDPRTAGLVDVVLAGDVAALCCHKAGRIVASSVLSNGLPMQRSEILKVLGGDVQRFARHRYASTVIAAALVHGAGDEAARLASEIMTQAGAIVTLACHAFGVEVVRAILETPGAADQALVYLKKAARRVGKDRYGAALCEEMGLLGDDGVVAKGAFAPAVAGGA